MNTCKFVQMLIFMPYRLWGVLKFDSGWCWKSQHQEEEKKTLRGFILSFSFTFNLPNVHYLNVVHLFWYGYYIKKNVKGRFFLRDATQQPPLSLSLSLSPSLSVVESDDFNNCVNWHYISFSIPLRTSIFVYKQR